MLLNLNRHHFLNATFFFTLGVALVMMIGQAQHVKAASICEQVTIPFGESLDGTYSSEADCIKGSGIQVGQLSSCTQTCGVSIDSTMAACTCPSGCKLSGIVGGGETCGGISTDPECSARTNAAQCNLAHSGEINKCVWISQQNQCIDNPNLGTDCSAKTTLNACEADLHCDWNVSGNVCKVSATIQGCGSFNTVADCNVWTGVCGWNYQINKCEAGAGRPKCSPGECIDGNVCNYDGTIINLRCDSTSTTCCINNSGLNLVNVRADQCLKSGGKLGSCDGGYVGLCFNSKCESIYNYDQNKCTNPAYPLQTKPTSCGTVTTKTCYNSSCGTTTVNLNQACPAAYPLTSKPTTCAGNVCTNSDSVGVAAKKYVKFTCPNGCTQTTEGGVTAWRCYDKREDFSTLPPSLNGACGQIDILSGDADSTFCGTLEYNCGDGCRPGSTTPPSSTPTATPTPTPTPTPGPVCVNVTASKTAPKLGDSLTFTCAKVTGAQHYEFRVRLPNGTFQNLATATATSNVSKQFTISQSGDYKAQCRICTGAAASTCQAYDNL